jgi:methylmalonyl-CoA mutase cobalamin-binding subunit/transposase-like protein
LSISAARSAPVGGVTIAAVERDTGLSKDTLRVWERRYGCPVPGRDAHGERVYSREQLELLRLVKRLLDVGYRPGQVVTLAREELLALCSLAGERPAGRQLPPASADTAAVDRSPEIQACFDMVKRHDTLALRRTLTFAVEETGLAAFVSALVAPLNVLIGDAWLDGRLEIFEEHFYTESVTTVLRSEIARLGFFDATMPQVLLTTFPQESHGLGLLMAETFFALRGCHCLSLGVQTPVPDIALAARAHRANIVVLSCSASLNPKDVVQGFADLRGLLPAEVEIWAGGACPALSRRKAAGVRVLREFGAIDAELLRWQEGQPKSET